MPAVGEVVAGVIARRRRTLRVAEAHLARHAVVGDAVHQPHPQSGGKQGHRAGGRIALRKLRGPAAQELGRGPIGQVEPEARSQIADTGQAHHGLGRLLAADPG